MPALLELLAMAASNAAPAKTGDDVYPRMVMPRPQTSLMLRRTHHVRLPLLSIDGMTAESGCQPAHKTIGWHRQRKNSGRMTHE